jgi:Domain of unknown function (DUF4826)
MTEPDFDKPVVEEQWCGTQRTIVAGYLRSRKIDHGRIGEWPAWHIAPCAALWAIESLARPEWIGWWVISGDLPTDYISSAEVTPPQHPRKAARIIAGHWLELVGAWRNGGELADIRIAGPHSPDELAALLESRAIMLLEWTEDETLWEND